MLAAAQNTSSMPNMMYITGHLGILAFHIVTSEVCCKDVYMETRDHVYWGAYLYVWLVILAAGIHVQHEPADTCIF